MIEVELTFRPPSEGGRHIPDGILTGYHYRPHIVIGPPDLKHVVITEGYSLTETYLGVAFARGPNHIELSCPVIAEAALMYSRALEYSIVIPEATFTLREGPQIVGHGRVIKRWTQRPDGKTKTTVDDQTLELVEMNGQSVAR
jgi:hypothetical protein